MSFSDSLVSCSDIPNNSRRASDLSFQECAKDGHFSGGRLEKAFENFNRCGLPCPVRSKQAKTFASFNAQVEPANSFNLAIVSFAKIAALNGYSH